tara:strand:+ start:98657 stop:98881 length:225 start_codon:yes stop_codon:yes gene_type:complete
MKIRIKEITEDGSQLLIYLMDENDMALEANIFSKEEKDEEVQRLIQNNEITDTINQMKYNNYIHQYMRYERYDT